MYLITGNLVEKVIASLNDFILGINSERKSVYVVVTDPNKSYDRGDNFETSILWQGFIGEENEQYKKVALGKAKLSWETGLPSKTVTELFPELLQPGDSVWGGSVVQKFTKTIMVISASGLTEYEDQFVSEMIWAAIKMNMVKLVRTHRENSGVIPVEE